MEADLEKKPKVGTEVRGRARYRGVLASVIPTPHPGEMLTQFWGSFQVVKARSEEPDRKTAKDLVENGERLVVTLCCVQQL